MKFGPAASLGALVLALAAIPTGAAEAAAPHGLVSGASATRNGAKVLLTFTPAGLAANRVAAGDPVLVSCEAAQPAGPLVFTDDDNADQSYAFATSRVRADGTASFTLQTTTDKLLDTVDDCQIGVATGPKGRQRLRTLGYVTLTAAGVADVDEDGRAIALRDLLVGAQTPAGTYKPASAVPGTVPLASAADTPPAGQTGYWSDGTRAAVVTVSAAGRRLLLQDDGGGYVRTNLIAHFDELYGTGFSTPLTGGGAPADEDPGDSPYGDDAPPEEAHDGVRGARSGRRVTLRFTGASASALRAVRGRRVLVTCVTTPAVRRTALAPAGVDEPKILRGVVVRVPRHGGGDAIGATVGAADFCQVSDDDTAIALAGVTARGRRFAQDFDAVDVLQDPDTVDFDQPGQTAYRTSAQIAAESPYYTAMPASAGPAPIGRIGIWTDGATRAVLATRSAGGARISFEDVGNGTVRTNLLPYYDQAAAVFFGIG